MLPPPHWRYLKKTLKVLMINSLSPCLADISKNKIICKYCLGQWETAHILRFVFDFNDSFVSLKKYFKRASMQYFRHHKEV